MPASQHLISCDTVESCPGFPLTGDGLQAHHAALAAFSCVQASFAAIRPWHTLNACTVRHALVDQINVSALSAVTCARTVC